MVTTGMLISGKMSVGVRISTSGVTRIMASASTTKVYGLRSANRTIHITYFSFSSSERVIRALFTMGRVASLALRYEIPWGHVLGTTRATFKGAFGWPQSPRFQTARLPLVNAQDRTGAPCKPTLTPGQQQIHESRAAISHSMPPF